MTFSWHARAGRHRVDKVLVAGIETVVGGNLAAGFSENSLVTGISLKESIQITGINLESRIPSTPETVRQLIERVNPDRVVFCGNTSRSCWGEEASVDESDLEQVKSWIAAASQVGSQFTLISSDARFTGPWMFHSENGHSLCSSTSGLTVRNIEETALRECPNALILRTNAFGWQPGGRPGWIESMMTSLERCGDTHLDCIRHATPILASDLVGIIVAAWANGLSGIYHACGAERVNPLQFASRLARQFNLPIPKTSKMESLVEPAIGFGCGETSLQTRKIRRALEVSMPMLDEGLKRLFQQQNNGHQDRVIGRNTVPLVRVA